MGKRPILNASEAYSKLERMVLELAENLSGNQAPIILIGVRNSGTVIAQKAAELLKKYVPNNPSKTISNTSMLMIIKPE